MVGKENTPVNTNNLVIKKKINIDEDDSEISMEDALILGIASFGTGFIIIGIAAIIDRATKKRKQKQE